MAEKRANISVAPATAMALRAVRVEMSSHAGDTMLSVDQVLTNLIDSWRENQAEEAKRV